MKRRGWGGREREKKRKENGEIGVWEGEERRGQREKNEVERKERRKSERVKRKRVIHKQNHDRNDKYENYYI